MGREDENREVTQDEMDLIDNEPPANACGEDESEDSEIRDADAPTADENAEADEMEGKEDSPVIKKIRAAQAEERKKRRDAERKIAELEAKLNPVKKDEVAPEVGEKPRLESFEYDTEAYESALEKWHEKKLAREAFEAKKQSQKNQEAEAHNERMARYKAEVDSLPVDKVKHKQAEEAVAATLNPIQQAVILKSPIAARLVYAIGNNEQRLESLSKIKDPIEMAIEVGRLEGSLAVTKKPKPQHAQDRPLKVSGTGASNSLDALYKKAQETGDYSKYHAAKREKQSKG